MLNRRVFCVWVSCTFIVQYKVQIPNETKIEQNNVEYWIKSYFPRYSGACRIEDGLVCREVETPGDSSPHSVQKLGLDGHHSPESTGPALFSPGCLIEINIQLVSVVELGQILREFSWVAQCCNLRLSQSIKYIMLISFCLNSKVRH